MASLYVPFIRLIPSVYLLTLWRAVNGAYAQRGGESCAAASRHMAAAANNDILYHRSALLIYKRGIKQLALSAASS